MSTNKPKTLFQREMGMAATLLLLFWVLTGVGPEPTALSSNPAPYTQPPPALAHTDDGAPRGRMDSPSAAAAVGVRASPTIVEAGETPQADALESKAEPVSLPTGVFSNYGVAKLRARGQPLVTLLLDTTDRVSRDWLEAGHQPLSELAALVTLCVADPDTWHGPTMTVVVERAGRSAEYAIHPDPKVFVAQITQLILEK